MKATELRIGNFLHHSQYPDQVFEVHGITENNVQVESGKFNGYFEWESLTDELSGIPITKEWIEKFGFENGDILFQKAPKRWLAWSFGSEFWIENPDKDIIHEIIDVKYVHQLQNLFFGITGMDLKINL